MQNVVLAPTTGEQSRHSEEKIIGILGEAQGRMKIKDVCAGHKIGVQTHQTGARGQIISFCIDTCVCIVVASLIHACHLPI
jgi:hypothetical protein